MRWCGSANAKQEKIENQRTKNKLARVSRARYQSKISLNSNCSASSHDQVRDHGDYGENQKQVNQAAGYVKCREPENPHHE
jgi:hypothetical protein